MKQSARAGRRIQRQNALATKRRSRRDAKRNQIYSNVREMAPKSAAIVRSEPKLRITLPMQAQIIALFVKGYSLSEISRQTHRARQTVTKVVRATDIRPKFKNCESDCSANRTIGSNQLILP
jgi:DNA-binding NarL/FixJ family response regulator